MFGRFKEMHRHTSFPHVLAVNHPQIYVTIFLQAITLFSHKRLIPHSQSIVFIESNFHYRTTTVGMESHYMLKKMAFVTNQRGPITYVILPRAQFYGRSLDLMIKQIKYRHGIY